MNRVFKRQGSSGYNRFPIPMRGNEDQHPFAVVHGLFMFPIPMRGNELVRIAGSLASHPSFRSP